MTVTDNELTLAPANGHQGVHRLDTRVQWHAHRHTAHDTWMDAAGKGQTGFETADNTIGCGCGCGCYVHVCLAVVLCVPLRGCSWLQLLCVAVAGV